MNKMIEKGTVLQNRYKIEKQIGQGGMGKVYVASDERFKSTVAIKETVFEDVNLRKAFEREARLLNSLKHSALPRVSDHFNEENGQFLVMEYIAGEDLAEMIDRKGEPFPIEEVLKWAYQLCDALEYLHSQSIIHRDIKPQNLKLTPGGQIILLDFGLAKGNPTDAQHQTAAKSIFGYSLNYASLEQIQGTGTEPQSDFYSLAATLYHLLTGTAPADALTRAMKVLNGQPDPLIPANRININIPNGVASVLQKAMALNSSERPASAVSMKLMLENCDKNTETGAVYSFDNKSKTELLNQETKIFSAATKIPLSDQTDVKTKLAAENAFTEKSLKTNVFPDADSKTTQIQPGLEKTETRRRPRAIGVAVFGGFVLAGSALSAAYLFGPTDSPRTNFTETIEAEKKNTFVITPPASTDFSNSNVAPENPYSATKEGLATADTKAPVKEIAAKTETGRRSVKETKNQSKNASRARKTAKAESDSDEFIIKGETIETKDLIIDENGIRMKHPPVRPQIPPVKFRGMSEKHLQQLEKLKNKKYRQIYVNPPTPNPSP